MALFRREPKSIAPVPTRLDMAWFRVWLDKIIRDSGVDPNNDANPIALLTMAGMSTHDLGNRLMDQFGGAWAKPILAEYMRRDDATPWGAIEVIAGWDSDAVASLETNLNSLGEMLVEAGREQGEFRAPNWT